MAESERLTDNGGATRADASLPEYAGELTAFHQAFCTELRAIVESLPIQPDMRILDVGCGDGFFSRLLAERLRAPGEVVGFDASAEYLRVARENTAAGPQACEVSYVCGDLSAHPFSSEFDMVWCAQSLYSLPDPVLALNQMRSALRPGGFLVVLENDTLHQLLLPWPPAIEIGLRLAEFVALSRDTGQPGRFYVGRRLPALLAAAGLEPLGFRTQCIDRKAPLDESLATFLKGYLARLAERVTGELSQPLAGEFAGLVDPNSESSLLRRPHFTLSWLNVLAWGRRA